MAKPLWWIVFRQARHLPGERTPSRTGDGLQRPGTGTGITILSKNTSVTYGPTKINIVDTPVTPISVVKLNGSSAWWTARFSRRL